MSIQVTPLDIALKYIDRGWNPCPVDYRSKKPKGDKWDERVITVNTAAKFFNGEPQNIGVILGPTSNGLSDVDLDCREAIAVSHYTLPSTGAIFGRPSARSGHRLYYTGLGNNSTCATIKYHDPNKGPNDPDRLLLELRIGGQPGHAAMTVFPGSFHEETGEQIKWEDQCSGEPAEIDDKELQHRVNLTAVGALLVRYWPVPGSKMRHHTGLVLGGFLSRAREKPSNIKYIVEGIARAAHDEEWKDRGKAAYDAAMARGRGEKSFGLNGLREAFGERTANQIADWIGYQGGNGDFGEDQATQSTTPTKQPLVFAAQPYAFIDPALIPPRKFLYAKHYLRGSVSATVGAPGRAKSTLTLVEAISMAIGRDLLDPNLGKELAMLPAGPLRVAYINGEETKDELDRRVAAIVQHFNLRQEDIGDRLWVISRRDDPMVFAEGRGKGKIVINEDVVMAFEKWCDEHSIDVAILDPLVSFHSIDEIDNVGMDHLMKRGFGRIAGKEIRSVEIVIHPRKPPPGQINTTIDDARGASSQVGAMRIGRTVNFMSRDEAETFGIEIDKEREYIRVDHGKGNPIPPQKAVWRRLVSEHLANGDDVATLEAWAPPKVWDNISNAAVNAALDEIERGMVDEETGQPNGCRYSRANAARERAGWQVIQRHFPDKPEKQCKEMVKTWLKTGLLYEDEYDDPKRRGKTNGLYVNTAKRPGNEVHE